LVRTASSGFTFVAAWVGIQLAASATTASAAVQVTNTIGSVALTPKSSTLERPRGGVRPDETEHYASDRQASAVAHDERAHGAGRRAERHPDAHLAAAALHGVAQHAGDADRGQHQGEAGEAADEQQREPLLRDAEANDVGQHPRPTGHECGIDRGQLAAHLVEPRRHGTIEGHDLCERPVAVSGELAVRVIDDRVRGASRRDRDVCDDADDFDIGRVAGRAQMLADRLLVPEQPARCGLADTTRRGACSSSASLKVRLRSSGMRSASKYCPSITR
jgi:hypothetical protein